MASSESSLTVLHVDKEHGGLRAAVLAILIISTAVFFIILNALLSGASSSLVAGYATVLSCIIALPLGLGVSAAAETLFKQRWHSGRSLTLANGAIQIQVPDGVNVQLELSKLFMVTRWTFALKGYPRGGRERRLPAGWFCLACELQQDEIRLVVYSYVSPKEIRQYLDGNGYHELKPGDYFESSPLRKRFSAPTRPELPTSLLTGKEGRFWLAERRRWDKGMELTKDDYSVFTDYLKPYEK